ncbi:MAG: Rne/Rng family ribonuclease [Actinobacteria bacterium]|nr:Rne/Rng family ribonuclease [Actinomycetota bacterium]
MLLENERMAEFYAERRNSRLIANSIFLGRVKEFSPSLKSYFINIGLKKNAFLNINEESINDINRFPYLKKGDEILVQLVKPPQKTKGAKVSLNISLPGHYVVYFPNVKEKFINVSKKIDESTAEEMKHILNELVHENCGLIIRTAAIETDYEMILKEVEYLKEKWESIKALSQKKSAPYLIYTDDCFSVRVLREAYRKEIEAIYIDELNSYNEALRYTERFIPEASQKIKFYEDEKPLFDAFKVEHQLKQIFSRTVSLSSGGYIVIDKREALTVIDVNSGRFSENVNHEEMALKVNLEAAEEVARQIRLRNISGIVIVDFVDMKRELSRQELIDRFSELIEKDRAYTSFEFVPSVSMLLITRKHMSNVATSFFEEECSQCHGSGWVVSATALAISLLRKIKKVVASKEKESIVFRVNERILEFIKEEMIDSISEIENQTLKKVYLVGTSEIQDDNFEIAIVGDDDLVRKHFPKKIMFTK